MPAFGNARPANSLTPLSPGGKVSSLPGKGASSTAMPVGGASHFGKAAPAPAAPGKPALPSLGSGSKIF
jgi:hypothetical protein